MRGDVHVFTISLFCCLSVLFKTPVTKVGAGREPMSVSLSVISTARLSCCYHSQTFLLLSQPDFPAVITTARLSCCYQHSQTCLYTRTICQYTRTCRYSRTTMSVHPYDNMSVHLYNNMSVQPYDKMSYNNMSEHPYNNMSVHPYNNMSEHPYKNVSTPVQ